MNTNNFNYGLALFNLILGLVLIFSGNYLGFIQIFVFIFIITSTLLLDRAHRKREEKRDLLMEIAERSYQRYLEKYGDPDEKEVRDAD